jgi:predicted transcriptional regulator
MNKALNEIIQRADAWPDAAREELAQLAREIEAELQAGVYRASAEELAGIDRGLRDSAEGRFASDGEVEAVFAKHRSHVRVVWTDGALIGARQKSHQQHRHSGEGRNPCIMSAVAARLYGPRLSPG